MFCKLLKFYNNIRVSEIKLFFRFVCKDYDYKIVNYNYGFRFL